ncbi:hypothetical protein C8R48DRAFT_780143 [Suillus tomentosus]|nr:hypothetical protein C8R48DRAFT_780143 [Suillus tomentosus]
MHPSCDLIEWSLRDVQQLLKVKGTIQDIDGECSLKVTGNSRRSCLIAPHYRLPLYALNKKIGIYRKVIEHLQKSTSINAATLRDTYASVMKYLTDVRVAFLDDAAASSSPTNSDFRSSTLDYYLWLDHTCDGFHDGWRQSLATEHGVTIEGVEKGDCSDILVFLNWTGYHKEKCKDHDICGAIQGSGGGEDMEVLLNIIDACVNSSIDEQSTASSISVAQRTVVSVDADVNSSQFPTFPLPFNTNCRRLSVSTLGSSARQIIVGGFGKWLPSHVAMRFREIQGLDDNDPLDNLVANGLLVTAKSSEEYLEIFGMAEMMATCQELSADRGAMSRFFTAAGRALYVSRTGKECVVEYGQTVQSMDELSSSAIDTRAFPKVTIGVQCDSIAECKVQLPPSRAMLDREIQTDLVTKDTDGVEEPVFKSNSLQPEEYLQEECLDYDQYIPSFGADDDNFCDVSRCTSIRIETSFTSNPDVSDASSSEHHASQINDTLETSPELNSTLRQDMQDVLPKVPIKAVERHGSTKPGRPVVFATQRPVAARNTSRSSKTVKAPQYTIRDLVSEAQAGARHVNKSISSFLMDPERMVFLRSTLDGNYDAWLCIIRHIASLLRNESMTRAMRKMAASLMSIDIWLKDISTECQKAFQDGPKDQVLPPLAHCVIEELSARAILNEQSVRSTLLTIWTKENVKYVTEVLRYLLHIYKRDEEDSYSPGLRILASVMTERTGTVPV